MSTKVAGCYYFSCRARSDGKIGNSSLIPMIKRSKMIDQTQDFLKFSAQCGNSMWVILFILFLYMLFCIRGVFGLMELQIQGCF